MRNKIQEYICPLCGGKNHCMANQEGHCWCNNTEIPQSLLELIPPEKRGKSCVCLNCVKQFKKDPIAFTAHLTS